MVSDRLQGIAFFFLILAGLVLLLMNKKSGQAKLGGIIALMLIAGLTLVFPLAGLVLAIPIFAVLWFDNNKTVLEWWETARNTVLKTEG